MSINEMVTSLPTVANAQLSDIVMAVQGYTSPSNLGTSVQETWQQVLNLMLSNTILSYAGNPNGNVAGKTYQLCYDSTDNIMYICTTTGSSTTAIWTNFVSTSLIAGANISLVTTSLGTTITAAGVTGITWNVITSTSSGMSPNMGYITNNASLVTLTLPAASAPGSLIYIQGLGAGGWTIAQSAGQQINIGSLASTSGVGGSISSTNANDSLLLVNTITNTNWAALGAPQNSGLKII